MAEAKYTFTTQEEPDIYGHVAFAVTVLALPVAFVLSNPALLVGGLMLVSAGLYATSCWKNSEVGYYPGSIEALVITIIAVSLLV